jgi:hypothetical protein
MPPLHKRPTSSSHLRQPPTATTRGQQRSLPSSNLIRSDPLSVGRRLGHPSNRPSHRQFFSDIGDRNPLTPKALSCRCTHPQTPRFWARSFASIATSRIIGDFMSFTAAIAFSATESRRIAGSDLTCGRRSSSGSEGEMRRWWTALSGSAWWRRLSCEEGIGL